MTSHRERTGGIVHGAYVGISGWTYDGWRRSFYPDGLPPRRRLEFAASHFNSIEINGTFYSLQRPEVFESWRDQTPDGFRFAVKGSRFITHMKQLRDVAVPLANFFASGVLRLEDRLGPLLWQFPARMKYERDRFDAFLSRLPRTTRDAARLARRHDTRVRGRASMHVERDRRILHAIEVRNDSFMIDDFIELLRTHDAALVFSDAAADWPYAEDVTADFVYLRLHGAKELYASGYDAESLDRWARKVRAWMRGGEPRDAERVSARALRRHGSRDAYVYFDNDAKVHAPFDAMDLADRLGIDWRFEHEEWPDTKPR